MLLLGHTMNENQTQDMQINLLLKLESSKDLDNTNVAQLREQIYTLS
jgi:hypothetical protein